MLAYARTQGPPPHFSATLKVGGVSRSVTFDGYVRTSEDISIPMRDLSRDATSIDITKTGTGRLHYAVLYRYRPNDTQPGAYLSIRIDRILAAGRQSDDVLGTFGIAAAAPLKVAAGNVFEMEDRIIVDHPGRPGGRSSTRSRPVSRRSTRVSRRRPPVTPCAPTTGRSTDRPFTRIA